MPFPTRKLPLVVQQKGEGYPILCLHGHPGSASSMNVFTEHLSQRFSTIAPDLRGYGRSRTLERFEITDHLQDLEQVLNTLEVDKCVVLGWSLGGILAIELALMLPERVSGLILVATSAQPRGSHPPISWQDNFYTGIASLLNWFKPAWRWNIDTFAKRSLYRYLLQQHTDHAYQRLATEGIQAYFQTSNFATQALQMALERGYDRLPDLKQICCPALVIAAECDRHITAASSEATALHLPVAQWCCYPNTAHLFPWEIPEQVLQDIDRWLAEYPETVAF